MTNMTSPPSFPEHCCHLSQRWSRQKHHISSQPVIVHTLHHKATRVTSVKAIYKIKWKPKSRRSSQRSECRRVWSAFFCLETQYFSETPCQIKNVVDQPKAVSAGDRTSSIRDMKWDYPAWHNKKWNDAAARWQQKHKQRNHRSLFAAMFTMAHIKMMWAMVTCTAAQKFREKSRDAYMLLSCRKRTVILFSFNLLFRANNF